ncbi:MAG: hypothetical protein SGPRY_006271, partial [Prymnesium sp.]
VLSPARGFGPLARRALCTEPPPPKPPSGKEVPKGFSNFFKPRPKASGQPAENAANKAVEGEEGANAASPKETAGSKDAKQSAGASSRGGGGAGDGKSSRAPGGDGGPENPLNGTTMVLGSLSIALLALQFLPTGADPSEITFADFRRELLEAGAVDRIVIVNKSQARVYLLPSGSAPGSGSPYFWFSLGNVNGFEKKLEQAQADIGIAPKDYLPVTYESEVRIASEIFKIAPTLLLLAFWGYMARGGMGAGSVGGGGGGGRNIFQVGKSKPTVISKEAKTGVSFKDVAGLSEAKVEVMELVDFLKNPDRYKKLGAKIPKGALLVGPPGTGKTLLAKATAGEANVPFLSVSGSDFIEMCAHTLPHCWLTLCLSDELFPGLTKLFVGVGPSRVRDLFAQAKAMQPCIVWIDEIDAVGRARGKGGMAGGNDERENTLNQALHFPLCSVERLLVEMDGFSSSGNIVVMGGTNRADILDSALLRPGRFDRTIEVSVPDIKGRAEIFRVHLPKGFSGAEIANVVNEGALIAARNKRDAVGLDDFNSAMDRVIGGLEKKSKVMTVEDKTRVAHHEAGHATVGWFLKHASPLLKVSIVPRGMAALGYAQYVPKERKLYTQEQMLDTMCMMLGGRVAEKLFFGNISTGAQVRQLVKAAYERTTALLTEKKELARGLAELLMEKEVMLHPTKDTYSQLHRTRSPSLRTQVIQRDEVESVLGVREWREATTYEELVAGKVLAGSFAERTFVFMS